MKKVPIFLLPDIGKTSTSTRDLLERHELYLSKYFLTQPTPSERALVFITGTQELIKDSYTFINPILLSSQSIDAVQFALRVRRQLVKMGIFDFFIVAGTPLAPYLIALLLKLLKPKTPIQVAVHGELSSYRTRNFSGFVKTLFLFTTLRFANAVRFVSEEQSDKFSFFLSKKRQTVFVTPVPIHIPSEIKKKSNNSIGFVGRLHAERGVLRWGKIASAITSTEKVIVGDGPLFSEFASQHPDFNFMGQLDPKDMERVWGEIGVLLSTAPHESYGLAMREALLCNIPVVSARNAGSLELERKFPELFRTFDTDNEAIHLLNHFLKNRPEDDNFLKFRIWFENEQDHSLSRLASVWRDLAS